MGVTININIPDVSTSHNIYTGLTASGTTSLVYSDIVNTCNFIINENSLSQNYVYVRITCIRCNDQYYKIKIK